MWQPLHNMYQNSRLPEGKHVLNSNHVVYPDSLGAVSSSHQLGNGGNASQIQVLTPAKGQPCKQACLRRAVSGLPW